jgi:spore maturation protein CgeB
LGKELWEILKILLYKWNVFNQNDIAESFRSFGHQVTFYEEPEASRKLKDSKELRDVIEAYDCVFSVNYFTRVSNACQRVNRKYICWTVDSPMLTMYNRSVFNECNYIFIFDKFDYYNFKRMGIKHIYYLPLAVNTKRVNGLLENAGEQDLKRFDGEISFVGGLYHKNSYDAVSRLLPEYLQGYFDACMEAQMDIFGENLFDRMLTVDICEKLAGLIDFKQDEDSFSDIKLVFSTTYLGFKLAQLERVNCLNRLGRKHSVHLYSDMEDDGLSFVKLRGSVNYEEDMPKVFARSKINMNFTIRNIRTGLPLRIWDILGAGGFLLTNYQIELNDFFENGKDLVYYESLDDMERKADYYLNHEEERKMIAENGHRKVMRYHSYDARIAEMLERAGEM